VNWSTPGDLRAQLQRCWDRGDILATLLTGQEIFPRRLQLKGPTSAQILEHFNAVRGWIAELRALPHYRIEMREFRHPSLGVNQVPRTVWVDSLDEALGVLGKRREVECFLQLVDKTHARQPVLLDWIAGKPLKALALVEVWDRLLDVVEWLRAHPRPGIYLRQVDIPGVHSKFIEAHRGILSQWLDRVLPVAIRRPPV